MPPGARLAQETVGRGAGAGAQESHVWCSALRPWGLIAVIGTVNALGSLKNFSSILPQSFCWWASRLFCLEMLTFRMYRRNDFFNIT